jgi:predicted DNA-binding protein (MmcQ/YjbR family)
MKYYDEEKMQKIRSRIEKEVLEWPDVNTKKMFGCPCYKHGDKLFAFLVTYGLVLTKVSEQERMKLSREFMIKPFKAVTRTMRNWPQIPLDETSDFKRIMPFIRNSYNRSKTE